jgi:uncharacterized protein YchJ
MTVIEKLNEINEVIKELFEFVQTSDKTKDDFQEYLTTMGMPNPTPNQMEKLFIPYAFERRLGESSKTVVEIYNEFGELKNPEVSKSLLNSQYSIFRVERILKNGFNLFCLTNERKYTVLSLTKMSNFRGVGIGEYIVARIFKQGEEYYLIGIDNMLPANKTKDAVRYAIYKIMETPWLAYEDNKEKEEEIMAEISKSAKRFVEIFKTDEVITTNRNADEVIEAVNMDELPTDFDPDKLVETIDEYKFFPIKELNNNEQNFLKNSVGGFSSHKEHYDMGIIFDEERGLYAIPFYKTFCMIFEDDKKVENAEDCIKYFLKNDSVSDKILERVSSKYPNFIDKINELLKTDYTMESLIATHKPEFLKRKIYSSTSTLFHSMVFTSMFDLSIESLDEEEDTTLYSEPKEIPAPTVKVGRNEPCPCGSGKKYKNCCGK